LAVSRTVSPWAIWLLVSSRSWTASPSRLAAERKLKRVRVDFGHGQHAPDLGLGLFPGQQEILAPQAPDVQGGQPVDGAENVLGVHGTSFRVGYRINPLAKPVMARPETMALIPRICFQAIRSCRKRAASTASSAG
jgi:hypothetical protein